MDDAEWRPRSGRNWVRAMLDAHTHDDGAAVASEE
jgi:hypothetical protein